MSDFLTRMVDRAMGRSLAVQPIIAPLFAPEPEMAGKSLFVEKVENTEQGAPTISIGSTTLTELGTSNKPYVDHHSGRGNDGAGTDEPETTRLTAHFKEVGNNRKQETILSSSIANRPIKERDFSSLSSEPQDAPRINIETGGHSQRLKHAVLKNTGVIPVDVQEESKLKMMSSLPQERDTYTRALHSVQQLGQQNSEQLLIKEIISSSLFTEEKYNDKAYVPSEVAIASALSSGNIQPGRTIFQEHPESVVSRPKFSESETVSATPTIKVSIGSVEVRAIPQKPVPMKRATSNTPKVSLDEYLKKQSEWKR